MFLNSAIWILNDAFGLNNPSSAYILTNKHTVIAKGAVLLCGAAPPCEDCVHRLTLSLPLRHHSLHTGHNSTRVQKAVTVSNAPSKASNITIKGTSVSFNCGGGTITFANLADTSGLFKLLQRRGDGGSLADPVLPAGAGAASVPVSTAPGYSAVPSTTFENNKAAPPPDSLSANIF